MMPKTWRSPPCLDPAADSNLPELDWVEIIEKYVLVQKSFRRYLKRFVDDRDNAIPVSHIHFQLWTSKLDEAEEVIDTLISVQKAGKERFRH